MQAAVVPTVSSAWQITDVPQPQPGTNQVLVKMHASGICYTDVHETLGHIPGPFPRILGHEPVGEIVAVAPDVTTRKVGDRVSLRNWRHAPEDWTYADAEIRCGPWQGRIQVSFYSDEVARFAEAIRTLYRELNGKAELHPFDSPFVLTLTGNGRGGIVVDGHAKSDFITDAELRFQFSIDQTFLPQIADSLIAAIS